MSLIPMQGVIMAAASAPPPVTYATWDPSAVSPDLTLSGGNLVVTRNSGGGWATVLATQSKTSGKWYYEVYRTAGSDKAQTIYGSRAPSDGTSVYPGFPGQSDRSIGFQALNTSDVNIYHNGFQGTFGGQADVPINGGFAISFDAGSGQLWAKVLGASGWIGGGDPTSGTSPTRTFTAGGSFVPAVGINLGGCQATANFGSSSFVETPPTGFNAGVYT